MPLLIESLFWPRISTASTISQEATTGTAVLKYFLSPMCFLVLATPNSWFFSGSQNPQLSSAGKTIALARTMPSISLCPWCLLILSHLYLLSVSLASIFYGVLVQGCLSCWISYFLGHVFWQEKHMAQEELWAMLVWVLISSCPIWLLLPEEFIHLPKWCSPQSCTTRSSGVQFSLTSYSNYSYVWISSACCLLQIYSYVWSPFYLLQSFNMLTLVNIPGRPVNATSSVLSWYIYYLLFILWPTARVVLSKCKNK